ncbi:DUF6297 family protein [Cutibacterium sp.]|uniref:DUF6297 family protein n=1 Tax=Cutibacterium sp. TaxID=1912221 RepID=UPI0026DCEEBF|nr:DUF6297 family protein [Cutibacterium sp.]MDO4412196.1 DUF6297 family protein [Cutibacterium sp.]
MSRRTSKHSKPRPKHPKPVETTVVVPDPELVITHRPDEFFAGQADERQLSLLMGDWRKGRTTRNIWQAIGDAYVLIFSLVVVLAMIISLIVQAQGQASGCTSTGCQTARGLLPWAALAGVLAFALATARVFGPVLASAAEGFWLMDAPINRARFLTKRLGAAVLVAVVAGAVLGALVAALTGASGTAIIAWTLATALGAAGVVSFAAAEQGAERTAPVKVVEALAAVAGVAVLLGVIATASGWYAVPMSSDANLASAWAVAGGGAVLLVISYIIARLRLNRIRRARLMAGGSLASGMQGAAFALDFALIRDILQEREAVERGQVRATRGRGKGLSALVWRDVQRLMRFPKPVLILIVTAVVPYAVSALGFGALTVPVSALVLVAALVPLFTSLRVLTRTKGLVRCLPFTTSQVITAASVVPAVAAAIWAIAVIPAFHGVGSATSRPWGQAIMYGLVTAAAGLAGAIRWVSAKPADYSSPMVATQAGAMPPGLLFNLIRGFDMVALVTFPVVLGWSPWISVTIAIVVFGFLRMGGMNQQDLAEMREESQRQLAEARQQARGGKVEKKVIERKRR